MYEEFFKTITQMRMEKNPVLILMDLIWHQGIRDGRLQ